MTLPSPEECTRLGGSSPDRGLIGTDVADMVAVAVNLVPGVTSLHPGMFGEAATHLPGRRVYGVQVRETSTHVHVVVDWGSDIPAVADQVRAVVEPIVGTRVDVTVHDLGPRD